MISNIDIERRKTGVDSAPETSKYVLATAKRLSKYEANLLKSKGFVSYMERLIKAYSSGATYFKIPRFASKIFPYLVLSKFKSYDFECTLIYDYLDRRFIFSKRR